MISTPLIGLDTNVLIRYLTQDDPVQSAKATEVIERRLTAKNPGFVSVVAMVETVWVLDRAYSLTAKEISTAVERLLQVEVLAIENEQEVFTAMVALKQGRGSFSDALIAELGARAGCARTLTFDQKALRLPGFEIV
jgi:predicted nucleic-acid-binding protein